VRTWDAVEIRLQRLKSFALHPCDLSGREPDRCGRTRPASWEGGKDNDTAQDAESDEILQSDRRSVMLGFWQVSQHVGAFVQRRR
jgi:hypothetical protein